MKSDVFKEFEEFLELNFDDEQFEDNLEPKEYYEYTEEFVDEREDFDFFSIRQEEFYFD